MALLCVRRMFLFSHTPSPFKAHFLRSNNWDLCCLPSLTPCATHAPGHGRNRSQPLSARSLSVKSTTSTSTSTSTSSSSSSSSSPRFGDLSPLERLRARQLRDASKPSPGKSASSPGARRVPSSSSTPSLVESFNDLGLNEELMSAVQELKLTKPTEVQSLGIPAVLAGESVVMASHTGSGKTLAYMLPIVQALRRDEVDSGKATRARRPRCIVLCPTRELAEQVLYVAKSICHHARFRAAMIGGGSRMKQQEDTLNTAVDMIVATPGRLLMHIQEGHMAYGDIKYVALDEADTMFDKGFAPEIRKFFGPLRNRSRQAGDFGFQTVLVTATITKAVQKLLDEEFPGIRHIRTSTLHKKVASARHDFIKLSGAENKLEGLQQVLEPSLVKRNRIMVFCNTVNSCRAVDHYLSENGVKTLNYHGEVPADERVEMLNQFREGSVSGGVPALVCTDLAARGLDLVVDHVIMFDFPHTSIDYLHRTGRTARMGAKGRVTSLVTKRDRSLAVQIEDAMSRGESLEALTPIREADVYKPQQPLQRRTQKSARKDQKGNFKSAKSQSMGGSNHTLDKSYRKFAPSVSRGSKGNRSKKMLEPSYR